ncbi:PPC domain-containing protein [cf. Phormidesmis sp. LEGE 11477]|uniref:PPC domain-containing protein n=1 Tax=cf. Phormidesmis sp. LEGE 11477 TaxID=1828680 RepID=UPI001D15D6F1|nr:PPC domain-containing protein [cf. Phormidesmis sp. LEGE 11477]
MTVNYQAANPISFELRFYGDVYEEFEPLETDGAEDVTFFLQPGEGYEVDFNAGETEITYYDSVEDVPVSTGGGDTIPEVGVTVSETELVETEETETTLTFMLSEPPPLEGLTIYLDSEDDPVVGSVLSQFDVLGAEIEGGNFPVPNADTSGFFFTITEQTATITLPVFNELAVDSLFPADSFLEGILALDFALQPQAGYTIDPDASEISLTIADNPESQIQLSLTGSTQDDDESTTLVEAEGTVSVHTFSLGAPPPVEGLTVSVSAPNLREFDVEALEITGGTIADVRDDGFDLTITEQTATINLPILEDSTDEGSETITFTLESGEGYELNPVATEATFTLADTLDQVSIPEESEDNGTITEANALSLSADTPSVSLSGLLGYLFVDPTEDVDFYSFNLEAGQSVSLDINSSEWTPVYVGINPLPPALEDIPQQVDTELRLFDTNGNELTANSDGAAPGEDFSRDPFIEYTAESTGTYYLGVSMLGNRNYDPNIARSGSGWTFPDGTDTILDFEVGTDRIGLVEGELMFAALTITQEGNNTLLGVVSSGETLAVLNGVQASRLTESSFEVVADVSNPEEAMALI